MYTGGPLAGLFWPAASPSAWARFVVRAGSGTGLPNGMGVRKISSALEDTCIANSFTISDASATSHMLLLVHDSLDQCRTL